MARRDEKILSTLEKLRGAKNLTDLGFRFAGPLTITPERDREESHTNARSIAFATSVLKRPKPCRGSQTCPAAFIARAHVVQCKRRNDRLPTLLASWR